MALRGARHSRRTGEPLLPDPRPALERAETRPDGVGASVVSVGWLRDERSVAQAYEAHGPELYRFVLRSLGDSQSAQDVVQETFLRAWRAADRYDPALASLRVWLFAIARNAMLDHVRSARVRPWQSTATDPSGAEAALPAVEDPTERLMRSWLVEEALHRLSDEHRTVLVEVYLKQRPHAEVAAEHSLPVGTVRSRVFYGLKALRVAMDEMGYEP